MAMASALSGSRWRPRVGQADPQLSGVEQWFVRQGVPQFMSGYSPRDNMPVLFYLLLIVVAFDLAVQPWVTVDPVALLILPAVLVCLGLLVKVTIVDQVRYLHRRLMAGKETDGEPSYPTFTEQLAELRSSRLRSWVLLVSVYVVACFVFLLDHAVYWSDFSVDFFVIMGLLWISAMLYRPDVWQGNEEELRRRFAPLG
jgi:membrane protein YdbS with pleckstrin-like domain